jgi:hypothetical protein
MSANVSLRTLTAGAPGYVARQEVLKAHYRRDVTLTVEILEAVAVGKD